MNLLCGGAGNCEVQALGEALQVVHTVSYGERCLSLSVCNVFGREQQQTATDTGLFEVRASFETVQLACTHRDPASVHLQSRQVKHC